MPAPEADQLPDVPANVFWVAGYTGPGDPTDAPRRTWAQLIATTVGSPDLDVETATAIISDGQQHRDPQDVVLLGPFTDPAEAGREQRRWLAQFPSPVRLYVTVHAQTTSGQPPHPLAVQHAIKVMSPMQPQLVLDDEHGQITVTLSNINGQWADAGGDGGYVMAAFGAAETVVAIRSLTIETPQAYQDRIDAL